MLYYTCTCTPYNFAQLHLLLFIDKSSVDGVILRHWSQIRSISLGWVPCIFSGTYYCDFHRFSTKFSAIFIKWKLKEIPRSAGLSGCPGQVNFPAVQTNCPSFQSNPKGQAGFQISKFSSPAGVCLIRGNTKFFFEKFEGSFFFVYLDNTTVFQLYLRQH